MKRRVPEATSQQAASTGRLARFCDEWFRRQIFKRLVDLSQGRIAIRDGNETHVFGPPLAEMTPIEIEVRDRRFYRHLALGGSYGAGESYLAGHWRCDQLVELMRLFARDPQFSGKVEGRFRGVRSLGRKLVHRLRKNTLSGSRRNISAHYDLGEDFYSLFLDDTLAYSCGIFSDAETTLREASLEKLDVACGKLRLHPCDRVIEIGSGWGGFAVYAARNYGCRVTTTTISQRQYEFTRRRIEEEGLSDRITVLCEDYRNLTGQFDKLVSIEMIEAVGIEFLDAYFKACSDLLKPDGSMFLQAILMPDHRFERYRRSVDFLQSYVFPGGCLPSLGAICESLGRATDLRPTDLRDITPHYAETLFHWRRRFFANIKEVRELGFSEEFIRLWEYYFCYCEAGFRERVIADVQLLLAKPKYRADAIVPAIY